MKFINGKRAKNPPNQPITFSSKSLIRNVEIATTFSKQFTSAVSYTSDPSALIVRRKLDKESPFDKSPDAVSQSIKNSDNSLAAGPDDLTIFHFKNLDPIELQYLTHLYSLSTTLQLNNLSLQYSRNLETCN